MTRILKTQIWPIALVVTMIPCFALAQNLGPKLQPPAGAALIVNTGSADAAGYRIVVWPSGRATSVDAAGPAQGQLSSSLADRFFHDLAVAVPLSQLTSPPCAKGPMGLFPTFLTFQGARSGDVSCGGSDKGSALLRDVRSIAQALYVGNYRVKTMRIYFQSGSQPAPAAIPAVPVATPPSYPSGGYGHM